ncbi:MAG TPA: tetratricopeptide repeat protein [Burkholderiaceae bacterium]|nr:tetratricopeptide repeat protein [Burkholderiaceae bacterium]
MARTDGDGSTTYTLRRVQAMLGLSRRIVAGLIAEGFVAPTRGRRNEWRFTFQDLMLLRTAHALQASKIPPRRILRSLARLKATLPEALPLTGLRITAIGADVAVRSPQGQWRADSGQLLMDFDVAPVAGSVAFLARDDNTAATWFERAVALERTDAAAAEAAYRQAIASAPDLEDAYLNLGAMLSEAGRFAELTALCDEALAHCPTSSLIHFNRGVALDHLERVPEAIASYERSLVLDPTLADAHYNLGRLQEQIGDQRGALRHFSAYRRLQR